MKIHKIQHIVKFVLVPKDIVMISIIAANVFTIQHRREGASNFASSIFHLTKLQRLVVILPC